MNKSEKEALIDQEVRGVVSVLEGQFFEDQIDTLKNLIKKFVHLDNASFKLRRHDLLNIISGAKSSMAQNTMPMYLDGKDVPIHMEEARLIMIIQATISYLNGKDCFKKLPVINYSKEVGDDEQGKD
jgi:hypothetical protein